MQVAEIITNKIIKELEKGNIPWEKPWTNGEMPKNLITKKEYRGINIFLLGLENYSSPYWLTYKQAKKLGGVVKKGEHGTVVVYWNWIDKKKTSSEEETVKIIPFMRYYKVFNVMQCEGIGTPQEDEKLDFKPIEKCELIVTNMPGRPKIINIEQRAYYSPSKDIVNMPQKDSFKSVSGYYTTLFHELTHSTGHKSRLNRQGIERIAAFGGENYSKEELVAEMGAAFLCNYAGILNTTFKNTTAYIQSWLKALKNDKTLVISASSKAQKAFDYILVKQTS